MSARSSHKHAGGHGKHKASASSSNHHLSSDPTSFLFLINELLLPENDCHRKGDDWYNLEPPAVPRGFAGEKIGSVLKYQNGQISEVAGYSWCRGDFDITSGAWPAGRLERRNWDGSPMLSEDGSVQQAVLYKQLAVFSCNPLLPIAVLVGDPLSASSLARVPLLFFHPTNQSGISQVVHPDSLAGQGSAMCKYVAGSSPSWMPSLVPKTYRNPYDTVPSRGLSGELPIILGLMAFSEATPEGEDAARRISRRIFLEDRRWRNGEWHHSAAPKGYARSTGENPRGFLVTVFYDPENEEYSNYHSLFDMEWSRVIVRDSRR
ncbi:hypothetical protein J3F83DRAFT_286288 [Trichoderma novae-zelandiae]